MASGDGDGAAGKEKEDGRALRAQRLREYRRAAVLAVAQRVFADQGYHATSIDDLIEAAGIARGTFYLYFESKRAIFDELLDGLLAMLRAPVRRIDVSADAPPPVEQLTGIVDRVLDTLLHNREVARILLREAVGIDADFDRKLDDFYGQILAMIVRALETGQQMGLVRPMDAKITAHGVLGAVKEVVKWGFVDQDPTTVDLGRVSRELINFTLRGLFGA